jgi:FixJ family two-component response regulator
LRGDNQYADRKEFPVPSVLLLDLKMRRKSGFDVLEWLTFHEEFENMLVVVLSGHGELKNVRDAYQLGAHSFLIKPCHVEDVLNLISTYPEHWKTSLGTVRARENIEQAPTSRPRADSSGALIFP